MDKQAVQFFQEHAGYATPPGRMICARNLAEAEAEVQELGWKFSWEFDSDADYSWMDAREREKEHEVYGCVLTDNGGNVRASLWGIFDPSRSYARVVEAELACEAIQAPRPLVGFAL